MTTAPSADTPAFARPVTVPNAKPNILQAIGNTPLVRLNRVVPEGCAQIYAKCEFMNPAGAIKDRMANYIIEQAEKQGLLKPGGTIIENTSGNTGMGVAMAAAVKGYRCVFTMPDKMSQEKINSMRAFGAEVIITPTDVPGDSPEHYVNTAKRIAEETPGSFYLDQYHTRFNIDAHYHSTGREIWEQTQGKFDVFMGATGTGGTVSGVSKYIKEQDTTKKIIGVDILGSVHYHLFKTGTMPTPYVYKVEGIGEDIECGAMKFDFVDDMVQVNDKDSFTMARRLVREEGLFCGGSSGSIVHAAVEVGMKLGPDKVIIVTLCDNAGRYISKYLNDDWMRDQGFMEEGPDLGFVEDLISDKPKTVITARASDTVAAVATMMRDHGVSQVPLIADDDLQSLPKTIVSEIDLLRGLHTRKVRADSPVREIASPIGGLVYPKARIEELFNILETDHTAIVVDSAKLVGVVSKIDLVEYLSNRH